MYYSKVWHVWYSGCVDNTPMEPDFSNRYYKMFEKELNAFLYAHSVVNEINKECSRMGFPGVEYGVMEVPIIRESSCKAKGVLSGIIQLMGKLRYDLDDGFEDIDGFQKITIKMFEKQQEQIKELRKNLELIGTHSKKTDLKLPKFICTLKEQAQCDAEGSMGCLKGNSDGERNIGPCIHGKTGFIVKDLGTLNSKKNDIYYMEIEHLEKYKDTQSLIGIRNIVGVPLSNIPPKVKLPKSKEIESQRKDYNRLLTTCPSCSYKWLVNIEGVQKDQQIKDYKEFREDVLACRGMSYEEMIEHLIELEEKYDERD